VSVGVSMDWPWSANSKDWEYKASLIKEHSLIIQKQKKAEELKSVFSDLKRQIEDDLKIFEHNKKTVQLSKQVLNEGRKDFYNGRLDFINLTDIGKLYIQDQKKLSSLKLKLISNLVLFLDYFQYFNGYLMEN
jgi:hypothetical protein